MRTVKSTSMSLSKGDSIYISSKRTHPGKLHVGLGWSGVSTGSVPLEVDIFCFMLNQNNVAPSARSFIFYNNMQSICGSVLLMKKNAGVQAYGDDEAITITLPTLPADITRLRLVASIFGAEEREQNFSMVNDLYVRIVDDNVGNELARFDVEVVNEASTLVELGDVFRHRNEWCFRAVGLGHTNPFALLPRLLGVGQ